MSELFFCQTCLEDKPIGVQSPDLRYCQGCYIFLLNEAEILPAGKRPAWIPKPQKAYQGGGKAQPIANHTKEPKMKMSTLNSPSPTVASFRPRGRPTTYKKRELPEELISQLSREGVGAKVIASKLNKQGIDVSYRTIHRILSGERKGEEGK